MSELTMQKCGNTVAMYLLIRIIYDAPVSGTEKK